MKSDEYDEDEAEVSHTTTSTSDETESTSMSETDSEEQRASWREYKENLKKLFYLFAGSDNHTKKKGVYVAKSELKEFLEIVEIAKYWPVEEVFKSMDTAEVDGRIQLEEFIEYFCDERVNPKASDLKKHIEKQVSWKLLLNAMQLFEKLDKDKSNKLEYGEFQNFGKMLNLNEAETERLWRTIDSDDNGQITIVELFKWFKKRLEKKQMANKKDKGNARDFSRSHSSFFDDEESDTESAQSSTKDNDANDNDANENDED